MRGLALGSSSHRSPWAFGTDPTSFPLRDTPVMWISIVLASDPSDSKLKASSDVCPPVRTFPPAGLSRGSREPPGDGWARSAAEVVMESHWISFRGDWKSTLQPVQP